MKTQEVKDEVARKHGYEDWSALVLHFKASEFADHEWLFKLENEAITTYAKQFQEQSICAENNYMVNKVYEELRENFVDENALHAPSYIRGLQDMRDKMKGESK